MQSILLTSLVQAASPLRMRRDSRLGAELCRSQASRLTRPEPRGLPAESALGSELRRRKRAPSLRSLIFQRNTFKKIF